MDKASNILFHLFSFLLKTIYYIIFWSIGIYGMNVVLIIAPIYAFGVMGFKHGIMAIILPPYGWYCSYLAIRGVWSTDFNMWLLYLCPLFLVYGGLIMKVCNDKLENKNWITIEDNRIEYFHLWGLILISYFQWLILFFVNSLPSMPEPYFKCPECSSVLTKNNISSGQCPHCSKKISYGKRDTSYTTEKLYVFDK